MLAAFTTGVLLALGHHLFYDSLDGEETPSDDFHFGGLDYSRQQLNIQAGTAFAFLVKAFLVLAISIAYAQVFWAALSGSHERKPPILGNIDTAFSALGNVLTLFKFTAWSWSPVLLLLSILTWSVVLVA